MTTETTTQETQIETSNTVMATEKETTEEGGKRGRPGGNPYMAKLTVDHINNRLKDDFFYRKLDITFAPVIKEGFDLKELTKALTDYPKWLKAENEREQQRIKLEKQQAIQERAKEIERLQKELEELTKS